MWYLWRIGPTDGAGRFVAWYPSLDAIRRVVDDIAAETSKKVVVRQVCDGVQLIVKDHATTLEALAGAVTYYAKREKETPQVRKLDIRIGNRRIKPGEKLPSQYLDIDPHRGAT